MFEEAFKSGIHESLSDDLTADGREFLMIERRLDLAPRQLNAVLDWGRELRAKVRR